MGEVQALLDALLDAYHNGRLVFVIGNGCSAANASHLCEDLGKETLRDFEGQKHLKEMSPVRITSYGRISGTYP